MHSTNGQCSLFLHPAQPNFTIKDAPALTSLLLDISFISNNIETEDTKLRYYTGEKFLNYVSYMGCAPAIQFEASADKREFCFIEIHQYDSAKLIHSRKQARSPHCPACNKPVKNWQQQSTKKTTEHIAPVTILCNTCNTTSNIETFNWRKMAGYARLFIQITDVFPKEAIPQQLLLDKLANNTDTPWQYFYSCK